MTNRSALKLALLTALVATCAASAWGQITTIRTLPGGTTTQLQYNDGYKFSGASGSLVNSTGTVTVREFVSTYGIRASTGSFSGAVMVASSVTASGFFGNGAGITGVTAATNANLTGPITSVGNATTIVGPVPTAAVTLSTVTDAIALKVDKAGDTMTGSLTMVSPATITIHGNAFSVGTSTLSILGGKITMGNSAALSNRLDVVEIGTGRVQIGTTVAYAVRSDTFLEVQGKNPGIGIYNTVSPADGVGEAFLEFGAYDSSGVWRDQGGLGTQWVSSNTTDGYASYVMDVGYMSSGVQLDDAFVTAYAGRGVRFFGPDRKSPPGFEILQVDGPFYSTKYHEPSTGTGITTSYSAGDRAYIVSRNWNTGVPQGLTISLSTLTISNGSGAPMTILNNGNTGINNTSPLAKLDVGGHIRTTSYAAPATGSGLEFGFTAGEGYVIPWNRTTNVAQGLLVYGSTITLHTQDTASAVTILNNGKVGVGDTTPSTALEVNGTVTASSIVVSGKISIGTGTLTNPFAIDDGNTGAMQITHSGAGYTATDGVTFAHSSGDFLINQREAAALRFFVNGSERLRLESTGNVGVRDTSPDALLEVLSNVAPTEYALSVSSQNDVTSSVFGVTGGGHVVSSGTTPGIACNAGTPIFHADSNDMSGQFAGGAASINCTVTFVREFSKKPRCWCNNETTTLVVRAVTTTTTLVCHSSLIGTDTLTYGCMAAP